MRRHSAARKDKCNFLLLLCARVSLLAVQETHGDIGDVMEFSSRLPNHFIGWSSKSNLEVFDSEQTEHSAGIPPDLVSEPESCDVQSNEGSDLSGSEDGHFLCEAQSGAAPPEQVLSLSSPNLDPHAKSSQGGCMNVISKAAFSSAATCEHINLVPGRCLASIVHDEGQQFIFLNIHNYSLKSSQINIVQSFISEKSELAKNDTASLAFVVCGDFNLRFDKPSVDLSSGKVVEHSGRNNRQAKKLISALGLLTRIEHDMHTL